MKSFVSASDVMGTEHFLHSTYVITKDLCCDDAKVDATIKL